MAIQKYFFAAVLFFLPAYFSAQTTGFIQYSVEKGMVQSQVQTLIQDDQGNLWIGTLGGLSRYNGIEFKSFTRKDSLAEDWVTTSFKDKLGNLWFGHWGGGVSIFNAELNKFINLNVEVYTRFKSINAIMEDEAGSIWLATEGAGIYKFNPLANTMISLGVKEGLPGEVVSSLLMDDFGNVWIGTNNGLAVYMSDKDITSPSSYVILNPGNSALPGSSISCLKKISGGEIWVGTQDGGIAVIKSSGVKAPASISKTSGSMYTLSSGQGLPSMNIKTIFEDSRNNVWVGTLGGGACMIVPVQGKDWTGARFKSYGTRQGLNYYNVNAIYEDREANVWIGTDVGLNQYVGERFQIFDEADGMSNNLVWSVYVDRSGNIWHGTNFGVTRFTPSINAQGTRTYAIKNFGTKDGLTSNAVLSILEDKKGDMWFGCGYGGICRLKKGSNKIESMNNGENNLKNFSVYSIAEDKFGNLWFGSRLGATRYDQSGGKFRNYTADDGLGATNIYRIYSDSRGILWFGPLGGNLTSFDGSSFRKHDESSGMNSRFILCISEDRNNNVWFGTYGNGLYKYNGEKFINYTVEHGLSSPSPYAIISDAHNNVWIGTTNGVDRFDANKYTFRHYGKAEGFYGVEVNPNAIAVDADNQVWFGSIVGAVKFNPDQDHINEKEPILSLTGLKLFFRDTLFPVDNTFPYFNNHITFKYAGVSLTNPSRVKYMYRLLGQSEEWSPPLSNYEATFAGLTHGDYIFELKACNNDGVWTEEPLQYKFTITPPFYKTRWFYFLVGIVSLFLLLIADRIRVSKLRSAKARLEAMVEKRTLELAYKNEELAEKNKDITDSIKYAKRIQEAILPPEKLIRKFVSEFFIFYKPKDIVSGDFYWMHQQGNNVLVAAVDCTGHGVPGALMSIVGNNLLNKALDEVANVDTAGILNRLNQGLADTIKTSFSEDSLRDGMDLSLININFSRKELTYSGAYNPAYVIRGQELIELMPDKISIGSYNEEPNRKFGSQTVNLEKGDAIYLFTDGYADQFGGPNGKKFKYNQFKNLLVDIQNLPMEEQKKLLERNIEEWRGDLEQVDDILVIGIKV
jgi:ligand-binding sensor domain-containing protein/serine phosphatase RsbU (regulator of sigma subunit)